MGQNTPGEEAEGQDLGAPGAGQDASPDPRAVLIMELLLSSLQSSNLNLAHMLMGFDVTKGVDGVFQVLWWLAAACALIFTVLSTHTTVSAALITMCLMPFVVLWEGLHMMLANRNNKCSIQTDAPFSAARGCSFQLYS